LFTIFIAFVAFKVTSASTRCLEIYAVTGVNFVISNKPTSVCYRVTQKVSRYGIVDKW